MNKWLSLALLVTLIAIPYSAQAQNKISFESVSVQLWPEYDRPDMLAILNLQLSADTPLPIKITVQVPNSVEKPYVVAVGALAQVVTDKGIDFSYKKNGDWLDITVMATGPAIRIEYYDPQLVRTGNQRSYEYIWAANYAVDIFSVSFLVPVDTADIATDPTMKKSTHPGTSQSYLVWETSNLPVGEKLPIQISYTKTSDRLSVGNQPLEIGALDENTLGRVSLSNYLPYILGGLGILLIFAVGLYFWQTSILRLEPKKRYRSKSKAENRKDKYCHQCGKRAQPNDRFCRICGTPLRKN